MAHRARCTRVPEMARMPYVDPASASPEIREALELLPPLNIFRTVAHADTAVRPLLRLGGAILGQGELDPRRRELAILRTAAVTGAEYEWIQHEAIARGVGASDQQIAAVKAGRAGGRRLRRGRPTRPALRRGAAAQRRHRRGHRLPRPGAPLRP